MTLDKIGILITLDYYWLLSSKGLPQTLYIAQAGLELSNLPAGIKTLCHLPM